MPATCRPPMSSGAGQRRNRWSDIRRKEPPVPKRETAPIGAPVWIDLFTSDPEKSRAFYGELMGWTSTEPNAAFGGYFNFLKGDSLVAGGMKNDGSDPGVPDHWNVY